MSDARLAVALEALRALEWSILDFVVPCCPECLASEHNGHSAECKIGRALAPERANAPRPTEGAPFIKLCLDGAVVAWLSAAELARDEPADLEACANTGPEWLVLARRFDGAIGELGFRAPEAIRMVGACLAAFRKGYKLHTEPNGTLIERDPSGPWHLWDDLRVNVERGDP